MEKHILYVCSTSSQMAPNYQILLACNHALAQSEVVLYSSFLDLELLFPEQFTPRHIREKLSSVYDKICSGYFDVIVPIGQDAIDVMVSMNNDIPEGTAIICAGTKIETDVLLSHHRNMSFVTADADVAKCLEVAMQYVPNVKNIFYLDNGTKEGVYQKNILQTLEGQYPQLHFFSPDNNVTTVSELMNLLEMQEGITVIIFHSWFNKEATNLISLEYLKTKLDNLGMPVFVMADGLNWPGAFGGFHADSERVGFFMAKSILEAISRGNVCTGEGSIVHGFAFVNYHALQQYNIASKEVPVEHHVLGEEDFLLLHQKQLRRISFITGSGLLALVLLSLYLVFRYRRKVKMLRAMLNSSASKILVSDAQHKVYVLHYFDYLHFFQKGKKLSELPIVVTETLKKRALQVLEHGESSICTQEIEGRVYKVEQTFIPAHEGGFDAVLWQMVDITEYVLETRKSRIKAQARSNYASMISYELRTPLNVINGFSELLTQKDLSKEKRQDYLDKIQIASKSMLGLVEETIDLAKLEERKLKIKLAPTDLCDVGEEVVQLFSKQADDKGLYLRYEKPEGTMPLVMLDAMHLRHILFVIMSNAIKYTRVGGVILRLKYEQNESPNAMNVRWEIEDTGEGIKDENKKHVFEPFENVNVDKLLRTRKGIGLGLPVARSLARFIGGNITFTSIENRGSVFVVSFNALPLATEVDKEKKEPVESLKARQGQSALLVDDSQLALDVLSATLMSYGFEVETVTSCVVAMARLKEKKADVVFTDYCMSDLPGDELAQKIHCNPAFSGVKVVAVTGDIDCGNKSGDVFDYILYKPVTREMLLTCLRTLEIFKE